MSNEITGNTKVFGILADPIHHVKTPQGINRLLAEKCFDGVMVPMHVKAEDLSLFVDALRRMNNFGGCVVTVPHKMPMVALCDKLTPEARQVGAVNIVHRTADGELIGGILDGAGFVAGLRKESFDPAGRSVYLAGAGGAASAIAFALAKCGITQLTVANRSAAKARSLIDRLQIVFPNIPMTIGNSNASGHDLLVNATSLGLRADDAMPLDANSLSPSQHVAEIIMQPVETALVLAARERGCRIHLGMTMLSSQLELMASFMMGAVE
jgi:shikimate dehydrogenase